MERLGKNQKAITWCTNHSTDQAHYHLSWQPRAGIGIRTFAGRAYHERIYNNKDLLVA